MGPFRGMLLSDTRWPVSLSPKGSGDTCISPGISPFLHAAFTAHAIRAVAALGRLLGNEGRLHGIGLRRRAEPLKCRNHVTGGLLDGRHAGARWCAVDQHSAGAALTEPAPELWTVQPERIAQDIEERLGRLPGLDRGGTAVDLQPVLRHGALL